MAKQRTGRGLTLRRIIIHGVVFLLLGAVVNVAVAWGCAVLQGEVYQQWRAHYNPIGDTPLVIFVTRNFGQEIISGCARSGTLLARHPDRVQQYSQRIWWDEDDLGDPMLANYTVANGWPAFTLSAARRTRWDKLAGELDTGGEYISSIQMGLLLNDELLRWESTPIQVILPMRPIWPGFAINTIFYAVLLWILVALPFALRRKRRIKRGRCPACGYPVGESPVCTECGAAVAGQG